MAFDIQFPVGPIGGGPLLGSTMMGMGTLYGLGNTLGAGQAITNYNNNMALNPYLLYNNMTGAISDAQRNLYSANAWNGRNQVLPLDLAIQRQQALDDWRTLLQYNIWGDQWYQKRNPSTYNSPYYRAMTEYGYGVPYPFQPSPNNPMHQWNYGGYYGPYSNGPSYNPFSQNHAPNTNGNVNY